MDSGKFHDLLFCSDEGSNLLLSPSCFNLLCLLLSLLCFRFRFCDVYLLFDSELEMEENDVLLRDDGVLLYLFIYLFIYLFVYFMLVH